jgi:DNA-directed RNA polymerase specialized sigma24 family protein
MGSEGEGERGADTDAVRRMLRGDEDAFRVIYRAVQPGLLRDLTDLVGTADAEDVAAEAWAQAVRDLGSFSGSADGFRGWITTIGRHRAMDLLRTRTRRPVADVEPDELLEMPGGLATEGEALAEQPRLHGPAERRRWCRQRRCLLRRPDRCVDAPDGTDPSRSADPGADTARWGRGHADPPRRAEERADRWHSGRTFARRCDALTQRVCLEDTSAPPKRAPGRVCPACNGSVASVGTLALSAAG